jgi:succinate-semialdehyde dehydrogenase/glutarate-semialdehyde dehydrogenase
MTTRPAPHFAASLILGTAKVESIRSADVRSPATGAVIGSYVLAESQHVEQAILLAHQAFRRWATVVAHEREALIRKATRHVRTKAAEIGRLVTLEQGKPFAQAQAEITGACDIIDYYAAEAVRIEGQVLATEKGDLRSLVISQPVGVVVAITPWNYPVALLSWKLGPALAAGCSVIVKPTPVTPLSPYAFCHALLEGGLPAGLLTFLTGDDAVVGQALIAHPKVAKIAFTGSTATGRNLMRSAGPLFKKITLELGGHCPAIVCDDADLPAAAKAIAYKAFRNMGQSCSSINRIYAHRSIHQELSRLLVIEAGKLTIGDGLEPPDVDLGPMTTKSALDKVKAHVADAVSKGANVLIGGEAPPERSSNGNYYQPTVLTNMSHDMLMMREETFGPVAPLMAYDTLEQALALANETEYGLCAFVFTRDLGRTMYLSEHLEAGSVCVNHVAVNTSYGPYEGWKSSGVGVELGRDAINEYLQRKHIKIAVPSCC